MQSPKGVSRRRSRCRGESFWPASTTTGSTSGGTSTATASRTCWRAWPPTRKATETWQTAIGYTRQQVALDQLAEEPQRDLMRRLAGAGDRAAAMRTYERLSQRLRDELRIAPSQATRELAETLRQRHRGPRHRERHRGCASVIRAVVTLLFTDLVGSTELLGQLGDDEAERLRRVHFGLLRDVAEAYGGEEVKNLGDGLMVAFASAVNAVSCAIGIQQAVHRHNARQGDERLQVRVGLNVGEPIRDEGDYFGTPVVVAKRLCDKADGGQILASELVRALVGSRGSFGFRSCGPIATEGVVGTAPGVRGRPGSPPRSGAIRAASAVSRRMTRRRWWAATRSSRSWGGAGRRLVAAERRVAMLVGEPGIGKTRLATEFCCGAYADGALVLLGRCYEESLVPYQSFVEAATSLRVREHRLDELRLQLGPHRATLARLRARARRRRRSGSDRLERRVARARAVSCCSRRSRRCCARSPMSTS